MENTSTEKFLREKKGNDTQQPKGVDMNKITNENFVNSKLDSNLLNDIDALNSLTQNNLKEKDFSTNVDDVKIKITDKSWEITKSNNENLSNEDLKKSLLEINNHVQSFSQSENKVENENEDNYLRKKQGKTVLNDENKFESNKEKLLKSLSKIEERQEIKKQQEKTQEQEKVKSQGRER